MIWRGATGLVLAALVGLMLATTAQGAIYKVTQERDGAGACDDRCTLREAIIAANGTSDDDTVRIPRGRYELSLEGDEPWSATQCQTAALVNDLDICRDGTGSLDLIGKGARKTIIDANKIDRVLHIVSDDDAPGEPVLVSRLTLTGGRTDEGGGGLMLDRSRPTIVIRSVIRGNRTFGPQNQSADGGGINTVGDLTLIQSTVSNNVAGSSDSGGGIYARRTIYVSESTIANNVAKSPTQSYTAQGGGIYVAASIAEISNSTISGNKTMGPGGYSGGGVATDGNLSLRNTTITDNSAKGGGGIYAVSRPGDNVQTAVNSIIAGNRATESNGGGNCTGGGLLSLGHNLENLKTCGFDGAGDLKRAKPKLGPLANNGGPTFTHALKRGSDAINAGANSTCFAYDQRLVPRPQGRRCDIGAFERRR